MVNVNEDKTGFCVIYIEINRFKGMKKRAVRCKTGRLGRLLFGYLLRVNKRSNFVREEGLIWISNHQPLCVRVKNCNLLFQIDYYSVARTDTLPNWYITWPNLSPEVITSTQGNFLEFVTARTTVQQWKRFDFDEYNPWTPEVGNIYLWKKKHVKLTLTPWSEMLYEHFRRCGNQLFSSSSRVISSSQRAKRNFVTTEQYKKSGVSLTI